MAAEMPVASSACESAMNISLYWWVLSNVPLQCKKLPLFGENSSGARPWPISSEIAQIPESRPGTGGRNYFLRFLGSPGFVH